MLPATLRRPAPAGLIRLLFGFLMPAVIWSTHLLTAYLLVSFTCAYGGTPTVRAAIGLTTAVALAGIAACGWFAYTGSHEFDALGWTHEEGRTRSRGFMARSGMYMAALFFIATLFEAAPAFALRAC